MAEMSTGEFGQALDAASQRMAELQKQIAEEGEAATGHTAKAREHSERRLELKKELEHLAKLSEGKRLMTGIQQMQAVTQQAKAEVDKSRLAVEAEKAAVAAKSSSLDERIAAVDKLREEFEAKCRVIDEMAQYKDTLQDLTNVRASMAKGG